MAVDDDARTQVCGAPDRSPGPFGRASRAPREFGVHQSAGRNRCAGDGEDRSTRPRAIGVLKRASTARWARPAAGAARGDRIARRWPPLHGAPRGRPMRHPPSRRGQPILARTGVNRAELPAIARSGSGARDREPPDRLESLALFARLVCRPLWPRPAERRSTRPDRSAVARRSSLPLVAVRSSAAPARAAEARRRHRWPCCCPSRCRIARQVPDARPAGSIPSPRSASVEGQRPITA